MAEDAVSETDVNVNLDKEVEVLYEHEESMQSTEDPPWEEWSSLLCYFQEPIGNEKQILFKLGLYEPPAEDICAKYTPLSDSSVLRHPYYQYPSVVDPGIEDALLLSLDEIIYADDGQDLYKALCKEQDEAYSRLFYRQLVKSDMNMKYHGVSPSGWRPMALALMKNKIVENIDFTTNFISLDGCYHFGNLLLYNYTIAELNFSGCRMGPEGIERLVVNLAKNKTLRKINLSSNELTDIGVEYLAKVIYKGANITDINLSRNELTAKSATYIATAIEFANKLTHLDLSWNSLVVPRPMEVLVSRFLESDKFVEINLAWNSLTTRFARALSYLFYIKNIRVINLSHNNLTGNVITKIVENLPLAKHLDLLDLSYNPLTIQEAKNLLKSMKHRRCKLKKLLMDNVTVDRWFINFMNRMLGLKYKMKCVVTHGYIVAKKKIKKEDMREIVLRRAEFLCYGKKQPRKKKVDVAKIILRLNKIKQGECILSKELWRNLKDLGAFQINKELAEEMAAVFHGPRIGADRTTDIAAMAEYALRLWPDTKLPPTPPPKTPKPGPAPVLPPVRGKKEDRALPPISPPRDKKPGRK